MAIKCFVHNPVNWTLQVLVLIRWKQKYENCYP